MSDSKSNAYNKPIEIISVNSNKFVVGLNWHPLKSARRYMREARDFGKAHGLDMVAIKKSESIQAGFAPKQNISLRGMYSLAVCLSALIDEQKWIAVLPLSTFKLESKVAQPMGNVESEKYIVIAVANGGAVVPSTDCIVSEEHLFDLIVDLKDLLVDEGGDSTRIFGDIKFSWVTDELVLSSLLTKQALKKEYKLKPLTFGLTNRQLMFVGGGVISICAAYYLGSYYLEQKALEEHAAMQLALKKQAEINKKAKYQAALENLKHPWIIMPSVNNFIGGCDKQLDKINLSIGGGWTPVIVNCSYMNNHSDTINSKPKVLVNVAVNKHGESPATIKDLISYVEEKFGTSPYVNEQDKNTSGFSFSFETAGQGDDPVEKTNNQILKLMSLLQSFQINFTIKRPEKVVNQEEVVVDPDMPKPDWDEVEFDMESDFPPREIFKNNEDLLNGIRILSIQYKNSPESGDITYYLKGVIYGRK